MIHPSGPWLRVVGGVGNGPPARASRLVAACFRGVCFAASVKEREREREREKIAGWLVARLFLSSSPEEGGDSSRAVTAAASSFLLPVFVFLVLTFYLLFLGCLSGTFNFTCVEFRRRRLREGGGGRGCDDSWLFVEIGF